MTNEELLEAIGKQINDLRSEMNEKFDRVDQRLDNIEEDIQQLKEDTEITRDVTNSIGEWIDFYFKEDRPYPIPENAKKIG